MTGLNGMQQSFAGVVTVAPQSVHQTIQQQCDDALRGVKEGKTMAVLNVKTGSGINLAIAHKLGDHFEVVSYIGKSGWQKPIEGGVSVAFSR